MTIVLALAVIAVVYIVLAGRDRYGGMDERSYFDEIDRAVPHWARLPLYDWEASGDF